MTNSVVSIQNSLSAGELSPSLYGRTDLEKFHSGTFTCRNFFANYRGGISSRAGLAYVGTCKQSADLGPPRDIPFQFNINQGYMLEFGEEYLRFKYNGAYVVEDAVVVSSVSAGGVFNTATPHGYSVGDWIYDLGNTGYDGLTWIIETVPGASQFTVTDLWGDDSALGASGAGTVARLYTVTTPYQTEDLNYLKADQSADTMTLTCVNPDTETEYAPYDLVRHDHTNWTLTQLVFTTTVQSPTGLAASAQSSSVATTWYSYVVTSVDRDTGQESNSSLPVYVQNNDIAINAGSNTITWTAVAGITSYNIYASIPSYGQNVVVSSQYGFIGTSNGSSFTDTNITPDFTVTSPQHQNPFARGAIVSIDPTSGGNGHYSQQTVGYSITTSTGSGFSGVPVIDNGLFSGFVVYNHGEGYLDTDTVALTDSGGGLATGTITFSAQPASNSTMLINNVLIVFKPAPASGIGTNGIFSEIEGTLALTVQTLANTCNSASSILSLAVANFTASGSVLTITYKTPGTVGNAFTLPASAPGFWTSSGANLTGGGTAGASATGVLNVSPQSGTYPSVTAYFQSRRVYANSLNNPDTYWMSQPGLFTNMDSSIPVIDSDAITGTPWAQQINGINFMVPMPGGLVVLTGKGAWQVNGGSNAAITPADQNAVPQAYVGCHNSVRPLVVNYDVLYVQAKGSIVRDLSYNFFVNIYTGTDITVLSNHLLQGFNINRWCYAEEPFKLIWLVRNDGVLLCLTYLKEQDVYAWTRHDTDGLFKCVESIVEPINSLIDIANAPLTDAVYVITRRFINSQWKYYAERMNNRIWTDVESSFCVDAGLGSVATYPVATLEADRATGTDVIFRTNAAVFTSGNVGDIIRVGGGIATVTTFLSTQEVLCDITQDITEVLYDNTGDTPVPAGYTEWNISTPVTVLSRLNHLEGETVSIVADGSVVEDQVVTDGTITLTYAASKITVGLPYTCQAQTVYMDHPEGNNTVQNKRKDISSVGLRVEATRGLRIGADQPDQASQQNFALIPWTNMVEIKERTNQVFAGNAMPLFTGDYYQAITSSWNLKGQIAFQQSYPLPANILACTAYWLDGDDK